jgi:hypothetical protein
VFVLEEVDRGLVKAIEELGLRTLVTDTIMRDDDARARLAGAVLGVTAR